MMQKLQPLFQNLHHVATMLALGVVGLSALVMTGHTIGAFLGTWEWLGLGANSFYKQLGVNLLLLCLMTFLPSANRVMQLELHHRKFEVKMEDVARAYYAAHADDRKGLFKLKHEFDAVKERLNHLRDHPELGGLEPDVLEIAALMSAQSNKLAQTYNDEKVSRARAFLEQRQQEVERARETISRIHYNLRGMRNMVETLDVDQTIVDSRIRELEKEIAEVTAKIKLPEPEKPKAMSSEVAKVIPQFKPNKTVDRVVQGIVEEAQDVAENTNKKENDPWVKVHATFASKSPWLESQDT